MRDTKAIRQPTKSCPRLAFALVVLSFALQVRGHLSFAGPQATPHDPLPDFEQGLVPMFVLGDLNEDGRVDQADRKLLAQIVASPKTNPTTAASCVAAGDLNLNSRIDRQDLERMNEWLRGTPRVEIPAFTYDNRLPCEFKHPLIASRVDAAPGDDVPIAFLAPRLSPANSSVAVQSGPASVERSRDGRGYVVHVSFSAAAQDHVLLLLTLPQAKYYLAYTIAPSTPASVPSP
jgi:hypothetical protein